MFPFIRPVLQTYLKPEVKIYVQGKLKTSAIMTTGNFNSKIGKKKKETLKMFITSCIYCRGQ